AANSPGLSASRIAADICRLVQLPLVTSVDVLAKALQRLEPRIRATRISRARARILTDLCGEVEAAIRAITVTDLGFTHAQALKTPERCAEHLQKTLLASRNAWLDSRSL